MSNEIMVRMGELAVVKDPKAVLTALGLGSCIGVCACDPFAGIYAMAHVVLPSAVKGAGDLPAKSADVGIPNLIQEMVRLGATKSRIRIAIAGGAQLFTFNNADTSMDIGKRNIQAVTQALSSMGLRVVASDTGGNTGRTMRLCADTGKVSVRRVGAPESTLADLARGSGVKE